MDDLLSKEFEGKNIRVLSIDGEPFWVGKDVCEYFGGTDHKRSLLRLDDADKVYTTIVDSEGRPNKAVLINYSGLITLLINFQPKMARNGGGAQIAPRVNERLEQIHRFKRWITSEVMPSILKTGSYSIQPKNYIEALEAHLEAAKRAEAAREQVILLTHENNGLRIELEALKDKISKIDPKAAAVYDMLINDGHASVEQVARAIQIGGIKTMNKALVNAHIFKAKKSERGIYEPYQNFIDDGYFTLNFDPDMKRYEYHITGTGVLWLNQFDLKRFISIDKIKEEASIKIESYSLFDKSDIIVIEEK